MLHSLASASNPPLGVLNTPTLSVLLTLSISILVAVFYAMLKGNLRSKASVDESLAAAEARVAEARADRDARVAEAMQAVLMWKSAYDIVEDSRRSQEGLLRETTMEVGRTVAAVIGAMREAQMREQGREPLEIGNGSPRENRQDA